MGTLRVCYFGTYRADYSRNTILIEGLRDVGVEVVECHETLWQSFEDREQAAGGGWRSPAFIWRVISTYLRLIWRYLCMPKNFDVMVVGYPGQFDVILARLLSWLDRKPLAWDIFMSIYLICLERGLDRKSPFTTGVIRNAEKLGCHIPDRLILDTESYTSWFCRTYGLDRERFRLVPITADERAFDPQLSATAVRDPARYRVVYYGTFIPNHNVPYIVHAARLLATSHPEIEFEMIGGGPQRELAIQLAQAYRLSNISFSGWFEKPELARRIAQADLCLGAFGNTPQSLMTVQNKIYEALAMARPVITGDSPAVRERLSDGDQLFLCDRSDPQHLADLILALKADPARAEAVAQRGRRFFEEHCSVAMVSARLAEHLRELVRH